ncbi:MAG TPA: cyclic nucleotide-binding domain-containing protein [Candidatus Limnocylindrales bacterium]|nr:cyclic nucleotide-binding domain-containing protein [Candidatus Limnocylindrales bacterium]
MSIVYHPKQAGIFQEDTRTQHHLLTSITDECVDRFGEGVCKEQSCGTELVVIAHGTVATQIRMGGASRSASQTIATLAEGESFGDVALPDSGIRSARAACREKNTLLVIHRDPPNVLCENYPALGTKLTRNLAASLVVKTRTTVSQLSHPLTQLRSTP